MRRFSTAVTITDPLVKYQALVATGVYVIDPAQHRLARHLRKVYQRIKDYSPREEYRERLRQAARLTEGPSASVRGGEEEDDGDRLALRNHPIWRNPLFKHLLSPPEGKDSLALTKVLTDHERAIEIDSPKGLFLSGEVGTGKSMLLDLLAEGLPTERKRRWHFNTFMLYLFSQLEKHRRGLPAAKATGSEYSILWMAKKLVEESPILFLDEFQLPDRAASKILSHLFIGFFQLGGVLVASSNRIPEDLQNAAGTDYNTPSPSKALVRRLFGAATRSKGELFGSSSDFASFLQVLKARCDFWQMEGAQDWRRREEKERDDPSTARQVNADEEDIRDRPSHYHLAGEGSELWDEAVNAVLLRNGSSPVLWQPSTLTVYGRRIVTPQHYQGSACWDFNQLVEHFGPADYISMASSYHTFIIHSVPVLTLLKKNEARRFITLLDALYEARCKLLVRAASPPDQLFFPAKAGHPKDVNEDATYSETVAEVYQDQQSPFRPNISYYDTASATSQYDPDQDSDFGVEKPRVDFGNTGAFTGEDERFAYKRATSRLWELCSERWHARTGDWWRPLPMEARHWEGGTESRPPEHQPKRPAQHDGEKMGDSVQIDEMAGLSRWRIEDLKRKDGGG